MVVSDGDERAPDARLKCRGGGSFHQHVIKSLRLPTFYSRAQTADQGQGSNISRLSKQQCKNILLRLDRDDPLARRTTTGLRNWFDWEIARLAVSAATSARQVKARNVVSVSMHALNTSQWSPSRSVS